MRSAPFISGVLCGAVATLAILSGTGLVLAGYLRAQAQTSAEFAAGPVERNDSGAVELYFPLERFLAWRSTPALQLDMAGDRVHVHMVASIFPPLGLAADLDILGVPSVRRDDFMLSRVVGFVDHIPVPTRLLLGAIALEGERYGVHVDSASDSLIIRKTTGSIRLVGYDRETRDLVISLPASAVIRAAGDRTLL